MRRSALLVPAVILAIGYTVFAGAASPAGESSAFGNGGWCRADTIHDSGKAPDITAVCVGSTSDGTIELRVRTVAPVTPEDQLAFSIDSDLNRRTGSTAGFDYWIGSFEGHMAAVQAKTQKILKLSTFHGFVRNRDLILIVNRRDLGNTTGFHFYAWSQRGETYGDDAPNGSALLTYRLPPA